MTNQTMLDVEVPRHPMWTAPPTSDREDQGGFLPEWMWNVATCLARNLVRFDGRPNNERIVRFAKSIYDGLGRSNNQAECVGIMVIASTRIQNDLKALEAQRRDDITLNKFNGDRIIIADLTDRLVRACITGQL